MRLAELRLENFRVFSSLDITLSPGINLFTGGNGAGKTSILEAVHLLSHARSFRSANRDVLLQEGQSHLSVFGQLLTGADVQHRLGLLRTGARWQSRIDGTQPQSLTELLRLCAVVCFEPGSHALISGPAAERRSFLDWGLFHVEQDFTLQWRRHQRALKQRNALLRQSPRESELGPWDIELAGAAVVLADYRARYLDALRPYLVGLASTFLSELGAVQLSFDPGWNADMSLLERLQQNYARDIARGFTSAGAHRADWSLRFDLASKREHLSRGQEKLCALACLLAQAQHLAHTKGDWPIICLDDLASELDAEHQALVVKSLGLDAQILITGTETPVALAPLIVDGAVRRFHVERGSVTAL
ncbi:DNA replication/repair protein RecF [Pseudolysobacter antarcticus]|uniref:DNA replication and repair protein RecF n=1 Tax=Pseudolysobacter antarcticus TaxID=2511995 RepID=A0A411HEJ5_9GAMM|nr:DNA replication/repair protein RecF [Pseudolysobacter antarcticus]QBB68908.1 DNA replication/repair protein RecF [Pseudolysobacter antarcticus]